MGFPGSSDSKESTCNVGDLGLIPGSGRSPGGGHGNPYQYSCLENPHGQRNLAGYSPRGHKESDTTEWLSPYLTNFLPAWSINYWNVTFNFNSGFVYFSYSSISFMFYINILTLLFGAYTFRIAMTSWRIYSFIIMWCPSSYLIIFCSEVYFVSNLFFVFIFKVGLL